MPAPMQLQPFPRPLGLFEQLEASQSETLVLKEKVLSLSGDSFTIKKLRLDGVLEDVLQVKGEAFSISEADRAVTTFYAEDPDGEEIFEVKGKFSVGGRKYTCEFKSRSTGQQECLRMKSNFFGTEADITDEATGQTVAHIDRSWLNGREALFAKQTYGVTVAPNVDKALIAAMCICLDEREHESNGAY
ncbi:DUF567-domain-containing protein [Xylariaceae sp. FL0594]|nr:DUF567-domain-containing protein [Xylariaceae sp. FL0594]